MISTTTLRTMLSDTLLSVDDRREFEAVLTLFENSLFAPNQSPEVRAQLAQYPPGFSKILQHVITRAISGQDEKPQDVTPAVISDMKAALHELRQTLDSLPIATMTLAYRPNTVQISELAVFLRGTLNLPLLLSLKYEPAIIGGFILECNGKKTSRTLESYLHTFVSPP